MNPRFARLWQDKRWRRTALLLALWVPAVVVLIAVREVLLPFLLAITFAYVLAPIVNRLSSIQVRHKKIPRVGAVFVVYAVLAGILWLVAAIVVPRLYHEAAHLAKDAGAVLNQADDHHIDAISEQLENFFDANNLPVRMVDDEGMSTEQDPRDIAINLREVVQNTVRDLKAGFGAQAKAVFSQAHLVVAGVVGAIFKAFLVLMLTAFITADTERIIDFFLSITPVSDRKTVRDLLGRIDRGLSSVVRGQLTICLINGGLTFVGLSLLHVKFAFLLATVAAIFSLVPIFGSILSSIPIFFVGLSTDLRTGLLAILWIVGVHLVEANLLNPKIMGDAAKIHPVLVVLALIIGEHYYGMLGALLAVPLMSILGTIFQAARARAMQLDAETDVPEPTMMVRPKPRRPLKHDHGST